MNEHKKKFYENQAQTIIKKLENRKMEGFYCEDSEAARKKILELMGDPGKTVSYGGSMTIDEMGIKEDIVKAGHELIIRENATDDESLKAVKSAIVNSDFFMTSTNAITLDGELINIDGRGNRVSFLIYGPENVIVVAGMNKVVSSVEDGIERVHNFASPPNTVRLGRNTPCAVTGKCGKCFKDSICCQIVITRCSMIPGRIKVILVGEELGF